MLHGQNEYSDYLLSILGLNKTDFGRFRDCYIDKEQIVVYTRCGGGNREDYGDVFDKMKKHPQFVRDEDDSFDCTYCSFYFNIPEERKQELKEFATGGSKPQQKMLDLIKNMSDPSKKDDPEVQRAIEVGKQILQPILNVFNKKDKE